MTSIVENASSNRECREAVEFTERCGHYRAWIEQRNFERGSRLHERCVSWSSLDVDAHVCIPLKIMIHAIREYHLGMALELNPIRKFCCQ